MIVATVRFLLEEGIVAIERLDGDEPAVGNGADERSHVLGRH